MNVGNEYRTMQELISSVALTREVFHVSLGVQTAQEISDQWFVS